MIAIYLILILCVLVWLFISIHNIVRKRQDLIETKVDYVTSGILGELGNAEIRKEIIGLTNALIELAKIEKSKAQYERSGH